MQRKKRTWKTYPEWDLNPVPLTSKSNTQTARLQTAVAKVGLCLVTKVFTDLTGLKKKEKITPGCELSGANMMKS